MEVSATELAAALKQKIALYEHLGIEVLRLEPYQVRFQVSLAQNYNHKGTAFGGSLYATAVLGAYALALAGLKARGFVTENIVIARGEMEYLRPVDGDFEVRCQLSQSQADDFFTRLQSTGRTRGPLRSEVWVNEKLAAVLNGDFVIKN